MAKTSIKIPPVKRVQGKRAAQPAVQLTVEFVRQAPHKIACDRDVADFFGLSLSAARQRLYWAREAGLLRATRRPGEVRA